jgi:small-conductance mechanosensitive channel
VLLSETYERLSALLPSLLAALALLLVGWIAARLLRLATQRALRLLETLAARVVGAERLRLSRSSALLGGLVFWVTVLVFVTAATQVLGLTLFTAWLARPVEYLPTLAAGLLIIVAGYVLAGFVADLVYATTTRLAAGQRDALARIAQGATLVTAILVGADQIGIKVTWLAILAAIVVATLLGGILIAVSLGASGYVSNLIGAHYLRQAFRVGERVRVAGFEGRIVEVTPTSLVLDTSEGRVSLPGHVYHDQAILLLAERRDG